MPVGLASQQAIEFSVVFRANTVGTYSAALDSEGIAVILTATVIPSLTFQVDGATLVERGAELRNSRGRYAGVAARHGHELDVAAVHRPADLDAGRRVYALAAVLRAARCSSLSNRHRSTLCFNPQVSGTWTGALAIGDRAYPLTGTAIGAPLPRPILAVDLAEARSSRQGSDRREPRCSGADARARER